MERRIVFFFFSLSLHFSTAYFLLFLWAHIYMFEKKKNLCCEKCQAIFSKTRLHWDWGWSHSRIIIGYDDEQKKMECCKIIRAYRRCLTLHVPTYMYMECACSSVHTTIKRMQECISFLRSNSKVLYKFLELLLLSLQWNLMNRLL